MAFCTDGALGLEVCVGGTWSRGGRESAGWQGSLEGQGKAMRKYRARQERRPGGGSEAQDWLWGGAPWAATQPEGSSRLHGPLGPPAGPEGRSRARPPSASRSGVTQCPVPQKRAASNLYHLSSPPFPCTPRGLITYTSQDVAAAMVSVTSPSPHPAMWACGNEAPPLRPLNR